MISMALLLAIDVSGSVNEDNFQIQRKGHAQALGHPAVLRAIRRSRWSRIAVCVVEWSDSCDVILPWRELGSRADAHAIESVLLSVPRRSLGMTAIGRALAFSRQMLFAHSDVPRVIDISGDGVDNQGGTELVTAERDLCQRAEIQINGLPIVTLEPALGEYYRDNVITDNGFSMPVEDEETFAYALVRKLEREIANAR